MSLREWVICLRQVRGRKQCRARIYRSEVLASRMKLVRRRHREAGKASR